MGQIRHTLMLHINLYYLIEKEQGRLWLISNLFDIFPCTVFYHFLYSIFTLRCQNLRKSFNQPIKWTIWKYFNTVFTSIYNVNQSFMASKYVGTRCLIAGPIRYLKSSGNIYLTQIWCGLSLVSLEDQRCIHINNSYLVSLPV